jgi:hypothetical protein
MAASVVASCSGLFVDVELAHDNRTVTPYVLANAIAILFNEFSGTYRSELRCTVVKARRRGCPWLVCWADEPWPPSYGGGLARSSAAITLGVDTTGGLYPSCGTLSAVSDRVPMVPSVGTISGGVYPPCLVCSLLFFRGLSI